MKTILVIEDDSLIAGIYQGQLEREGFNVEVAHDGETGLSKINELQPDGVLLDLMLPKITGMEIIQKIRVQERFKQLPIVVFSNSFVPNLFQKAREAGATNVFNKASSRPSEMVKALKVACGLDSTGAPPRTATEIFPRKPGGTASIESVGGTEMAFTLQSELRGKFLGEMPERLGSLRKLFQDANKPENLPSMAARLMDLYRLVHRMTGHAGLSGLNQIAQVCSALEALLKELHDKPKYINPSSLRTIAQTLDLLSLLTGVASDTESQFFQPALILVVDDDVISRQAVRSALDKANLKCVSVEDPELALKLSEENRFDLVLSDVEMPVLNGFEMCQKLRAIPGNEKIPFVFVTSLIDFEARKRSILSGGNDLIGKPFLLIELAVKALNHILKNQKVETGAQ